MAPSSWSRSLLGGWGDGEYVVPYAIFCTHCEVAEIQQLPLRSPRRHGCGHQLGTARATLCPTCDALMVYTRGEADSAGFVPRCERGGHVPQPTFHSPSPEAPLRWAAR
ncbi:hypothetical protein [Lentzea sp. E54]|uniref:hypothetical protein n=1 Tax=Lentzea xerophila TaxID=3435883 RepID=UPI003DA5D2A3